MKLFNKLNRIMEEVSGEEIEKACKTLSEDLSYMDIVRFCESPKSLSEIANVLSKDIQSTSDDMRRLEMAGLVENVGEEWRSTGLALKIVVQFSSQIRLLHFFHAKEQSR